MLRLAGEHAPQRRLAFVVPAREGRATRRVRATVRWPASPRRPPACRRRWRAELCGSGRANGPRSRAGPPQRRPAPRVCGRSFGSTPPAGRPFRAAPTKRCQIRAGTGRGRTGSQLFLLGGAARVSTARPAPPRRLAARDSARHAERVDDGLLRVQRAAQPEEGHRQNPRQVGPLLRRLNREVTGERVLGPVERRHELQPRRLQLTRRIGAHVLSSSHSGDGTNRQTRKARDGRTRRAAAGDGSQSCPDESPRKCRCVPHRALDCLSAPSAQTAKEKKIRLRNLPQSEASCVLCCVPALSRQLDWVNWGKEIPPRTIWPG